MSFCVKNMRIDFFAAFVLAVLIASLFALSPAAVAPGMAIAQDGRQNSTADSGENEIFKHLDEFAAAARKLPEALVVKVLEGDTYRVKMDGKNVDVRLIGIDTPESFSSHKAWRDAKRQRKELSTIIGYGVESAEFVRQFIKPGDALFLEYDVKRYDKYDRLLVYAYLPSGKMVNEFIIESGYAFPLTIPPNVKYKDRFVEGYRKAQATRAGFWK